MVPTLSPTVMNGSTATLSCAAVLAALALSPRPAAAQNDPRYFGQIRAELQAMGLAAQCAAPNATTGRCQVRVDARSAYAAQPNGQNPASNRRFLLTLEYSDSTDTLYVYVDHYAVLRADAPTAPAAFRRMMEMNWEMLVGKLEWSPRSGEVRLGAVMSTDSNFDRRAFRGTVRAVLRLADRYAEEVSRLTGSAVGE